MSTNEFAGVPDTHASLAT